MKSPLHILHLEDNAIDATLVKHTLEAEGIVCAITRVQTRPGFVAALEAGGTDLILSDFSLPAFDGLSALKIVRDRWPAIPFIIVSGTLGEEQAIDSVKSGATDYVLKERLSRLVPAVRRALREAEERGARCQAEANATRELEFSEAALSSQPGVFYLFDESLTFLRWNKNFERVAGRSQAEFSRMSPLDVFVGAERDRIAEKIREVFTTGASNCEALLTAKDGTSTPFYFTGKRIVMDGRVCLIGTGIDLSERKQLEAQFVAAQKMEVIGHLAGGVAHDFNNILAVIMGYSDLLTTEMGPDNPLHKYAEEIKHASERAAGLTRQLLIFSRKETVQPVVLDLNDAVTGLDKMLRRLISEHIAMTMVLGKSIGRIKADPGYLGQVLMNLIVNARDAMPHGGKLTISTRDVTLDENNAPRSVNTGPGTHVMLSVSDTGTGMTDEVKAHLFEAFYTTKPAGKGTGLGLATCKTIVQQCGGHLRFDSTLGQGTTFTICFPRVDLPVDDDTQFIQTGPPPGGTETLLVVEDEPTLRHLACEVLQARGYEVLSATNGQEALHVVREHRGAPIRLVITDVIMPLMGGAVMAEWLKTTYPEMEILFTSGYTDEAISHHGVLEPGVAFLPKPYTPATLARKVRVMLDTP